MERERQLAYLDRLLSLVDSREAPAGRGSVAVSRYLDHERFLAEQRWLFQRGPLPLAHVSELAEPGRVLCNDATGVPILLVKDTDAAGTLRGFLNICRHRGSRLVSEPCSTKKALLCRYHAWAYHLDGKLFNIPQEDTFLDIDKSALGLIEIPTAIRHGFVWTRAQAANPQTENPDPIDLDVHLGSLSPELSSFGIDSHILFKKISTKRRTNWKLIIEAFLEGYHVKSLHRESLARFFYDAVIIEQQAPHMRSIGIRKTIETLRGRARAEWNFREHTTVFYHLFPNNILVFHPDWMSFLSVYPVAIDETLFVHHALIPSEPRSEAERAHYEKSFQLIDGHVFQKEDLDIAESIQSGLHAVAGQRFVLGGLESAIGAFHDAIDRAIAGPHYR